MTKAPRSQNSDVKCNSHRVIHSNIAGLDKRYLKGLDFLTRFKTELTNGDEAFADQILVQDSSAP